MNSSGSVAAILAPITRKRLAIELLSKTEPVSHLAAREQVSRQFLYATETQRRESSGSSVCLLRPGAGGSVGACNW